MEVKKTPLLFQQELNTFYKDVLNCEITHPRYREWRVPETFFLRKRRWIDQYIDWGWDEVIDYILYGGKEYALVRDWNNLDVKVRWVNWPETISRDTYNINVNHSFKEWFQNVKWNIKTSGNAISFVNVWDPDYAPWVIRLKDASASWTPWAYEWMYVALIDWWTTPGYRWDWQVARISANWTTYLTLETWVAIPPENCAYRIYDEYWPCLAFIWWTYIYTIANDQVQSSSWISNWLMRYANFSETWAEIIDADWNDWRIFMIRADWAVLCSATTDSDWDSALYWWMFAWYWNNSSDIWYVQWAIRIMKFNNILVIFTKNKIYLVKKVTLARKDSDWNVFNYDWYQTNLAFWFMWLHNMKAVCSYNTWIYFISNKNTFLSLNIEETYYNYYRTTTEDMWVDIQQWLDNIWVNDPISIWINAETIYITWKQETFTTIFQYDVYYKFWHRRETLIPIVSINVDTDTTYLWPYTYRYNLYENMVDYEDLEYTQKLRFINWDSDVFSLKTLLYHKIFLWPETDKESYVLYKARLSTQTYKYKIPFNNVDYLTQINNLTVNTTLWQSLLWYQVLWWLSEDNLLWTLVADIDVIDIPLWLTYSLIEITIVWQFEIWWNLLWALVHDDHITPYEDVVPYFS